MDVKVVYGIEVVGLQNADRSTLGFINRNRQLRDILREVPEQGSAAYRELDQRLRAASNGTRTLAGVVNQLTEEYSQNAVAIRQFNREIRQGEASVNSLNTLRNRLVEVRQELARVSQGSTAFRTLSAESARLATALREAEVAAGIFGRNVGNYPTLAGNIGNAFRSVGQVLLATFSIQGIINTASRALRSFLQTSEEFSRTIATVRAVSGATDEEFRRLSESAQALGRATSFSATSAAQGMVELARQGFSVNEVLAVTPRVLRLAEAANVDLAQAAATTGTVLRTYAEDAANAGTTTDIITRTINTSRTDLIQFNEAFRQIDPAAAALNIPLTEVAATIGLLGDRGLTGTDATTVLSTALARLASQPPVVADELERLNLQAFDQQGRFVGLANLLEELEGRYQNFTDEQIAASSAALFGARAYRQINILLTSQKDVQDGVTTSTFRGAEALRQYAGDLERTGLRAGAFTQEIADIQLDSFAGAVTLLRSATEGLELSILSLIETPLRGFIDFARELTNQLSALAQGTSVLSEAFNNNRVLLVSLAAILGTYSGILLLVAARTRLVNAAIALNNRLLLLTPDAYRNAGFAKRAYTLLVTVLTGRITLLAAAQRALTLVTTTLGGAFVAITAVIGAIAFVVDRYRTAQARATEEANKFITSQDNIRNATEDVRKELVSEVQALDTLFAPLRRTTEGTEERRAAVVELTRAYPDLFRAFDLDEASQERLTEAYSAATSEIARRLVVQRALQQGEEILENITDLEIQRQTAIEAVTEAERNLAEAIRERNESGETATAGGAGFQRTVTAGQIAVNNAQQLANEARAARDAIGEEISVAITNFDSLEEAAGRVLENVLDGTDGIVTNIGDLAARLGNLRDSFDSGTRAFLTNVEADLEAFSQTVNGLVETQGRAGIALAESAAEAFKQRLRDNEVFARLSAEQQQALLLEVDNRVANARRTISNRLNADTESDEQKSFDRRLANLQRLAQRIIDAEANLSQRLLAERANRERLALLSDSAFAALSAERQLALLRDIEIRLADERDKFITAEQRQEEEAQAQRIQTIISNAETLRQQQILIGNQRIADLRAANANTEAEEDALSARLIQLRINRNFDLAEAQAQGDVQELRRIQGLRQDFAQAVGGEVQLISDELRNLEEEFNRQLQLSFAVRRRAIQVELDQALQDIETLRAARVAQQEEASRQIVSGIDASEASGALDPTSANQLREQEATRLAQRLREIESESQAARIQAQNDFNSEIAGLVGDLNRLIESDTQAAVNEADAAFNSQLQTLVQQLTAREITEQEFNARKERLEREHEEELRQIALSGLQARLALAEIGGQEFLRIQAQINALERTGIQNQATESTRLEGLKQEAIDATQKLYRQSIQTLSSAFQSFTDTLTQTAERRIEALERERTALETTQAATERRIQIETEDAILRIRRDTEDSALADQLAAREIERRDNLITDSRRATEERIRANEIEAASEERRLARIARAEERLENIRSALDGFREAQKTLALINDENRARRRLAIEAREQAAKGGTAVAEQAKLPFPANIVAILATVAAITSAVANIRQLFAQDGGFIDFMPDLFMASGGAVPTVMTVRKKRKARVRVPRSRRIMQGSRHFTGGIPTELERGEYVSSIPTTDAMLPQLNWMNNFGNQTRGKVPVKFPRELFPHQEDTSTPFMTRPPSIRSDIRPLRGYGRDGGFAVEGEGFSVRTEGSTGNQDNMLLEQTEVLEEISAKLTRVETATRENRRVIFSLSRFDEARSLQEFQDNITQS